MSEVSRFDQGDRVRVDTCDEHHGRHGEIVGTTADSSTLTIAFDDETVHEFDPEHLRPAPTVEIDLTEREYDTMTNIWGTDVPRDVREIETELLWEIKQRVSKAVVACYDDDDMEALGILLSIEVTVSQVLGERQVRE